jgi:hypothetical protein
MWRASCTRAILLSASASRDRQSSQSSLESIGAPVGVQKTRSQIPVLPGWSGSEPLGGLLTVLGDERRGQG